MRYYENEYPELNEIVFVTISDFSTDGINCKLIEYEKDGFIFNTELPKKIYYSREKYFKEKNIYPMIITNVDKNRIDVSYNKIKVDKHDNLLKNFEYASKIFRLICEFELITKIPTENILTLTMHKFFHKDDLDEYKMIYDNILEDPYTYFKEMVTVYPTESEEFLKSIKSRINITQIVIHQEFELLVCCNRAIEILKEILNYEDVNLKIEYLNAPKYRMVVIGTSEQECNDKLNGCIDILNSRIIGKNIIFKIGQKNVVKEKEKNIRFLNKNQKS